MVFIFINQNLFSPITQNFIVLYEICFYCFMISGMTSLNDEVTLTIGFQKSGYVSVILLSGALELRTVETSWSGL